MNNHDHDDPMSLVSQLDATFEAVETRCPHCNAVPAVTPAAGTRYVLGVDHEPGCPEHIDEDAMPAAICFPVGASPDTWGRDPVT